MRRIAETIALILSPIWLPMFLLFLIVFASFAFTFAIFRDLTDRYRTDRQQ